MATLKRRTGILAGGGSLPREIAESVAARGNAVHIVAIDGEADASFGTLPLTRVNWGQIGGMLKALKTARAEDLVIVGRVRRPDPLRLRTDLGFYMNLPAIARIVASGGDDSVLRKVVRFFETQGLRVVSPAEAAPELVMGEGPLGAAAPSPEDAADIAKGFALVRALGRHDIGQSVIVTGGAIEAIEGAEGTDGMLARVGLARRAAGAARRGILVKRTKPGQDLRVDMPAIGPETITRVVDTGLKGVAVEAGRVLVALRRETVERADAAGVFVAGCEDVRAMDAVPRDNLADRYSFPALGRVAPHARHRSDVAKGAAVLESLEPFGVGRAVVVVRGHVLAVEAGEGVGAAVERAVRLRQWGSLPRRRRGVLVVRDAAELSADVIRALGEARYGGAVALAQACKAAAIDDAIAAADRAGLFILVRAEGAHP
jgi:DUF1009 family protein